MKNTTISVRLTEEEKNNLLAYCEKEELPMSQVIRKAIKEFLSKDSNK